MDQKIVDEFFTIFSKNSYENPQDILKANVFSKDYLENIISIKKLQQILNENHDLLRPFCQRILCVIHPCNIETIMLFMKVYKSDILPQMIKYLYKIENCDTYETGSISSITNLINKFCDKYFNEYIDQSKSSSKFTYF